MISLKPKYRYQILFLLLSQCICWLPWGGCIYLEHSEDWMEYVKERWGKKREKAHRLREKKNGKSNRAREGKTDYKRMSRRPRDGKKDVYICSSMHSAHVYVPSPRWCTQGSNDECILSQSPLLTLWVHQPFCCWQTRKNHFIIYCFCCSENEHH